MAELKVDGRMKMRTLKTYSMNAFGCARRVYTASVSRPVSDDTLLADLASKMVADILSVGGNTQVGYFEKKCAETYGFGVQVATPSDSALADNGIPLVAAGR